MANLKVNEKTSTSEFKRKHNLLVENAPLMVEVSNINSISSDICNSLRCGDLVIKKTGNQKHCYRVSYKEEKQGLCLTYVDASLVETVSYDYTGGNWVYNSTDSTQIGG